MVTCYSGGRILICVVSIKCKTVRQQLYGAAVEIDVHRVQGRGQHSFECSRLDGTGQHPLRDLSPYPPYHYRHFTVLPEMRTHTGTKQLSSEWLVRFHSQNKNYFTLFSRGVLEWKNIFDLILVACFVFTCVLRDSFKIESWGAKGKQKERSIYLSFVSLG